MYTPTVHHWSTTAHHPVRHYRPWWAWNTSPDSVLYTSIVQITATPVLGMVNSTSNAFSILSLPTSNPMLFLPNSFYPILACYFNPMFSLPTPIAFYSCLLFQSLCYPLLPTSILPPPIFCRLFWPIFIPIFVHFIPTILNHFLSQGLVPAHFEGGPHRVPRPALLWRYGVARCKTHRGKNDMLFW